MTYRHSMTCYTEGIDTTAPMRWRGLDGLVSVYWQARGQVGAQGYYLSPDPRIVLFFDDVAPHIRMTNHSGGIGSRCRGMARAIYVPSGVPLWTRFTSGLNFRHLDLHIHQDRLLRYLVPSVGQSAALAALRRPVEIQDAEAVQTLALLLADEIAMPAKHPVYAEHLVGSIVACLLDVSAADAPVSGGLTQLQMDRLAARLRGGGGRRLSLAEMAETVGLSESWFSHAFKRTTGTTPLQWQLDHRIDMARQMLTDTDQSVASIAAHLGFSDQAHLTRAFRQVAGETPGAWRRMRRGLHG